MTDAARKPENSLLLHQELLLLALRDEKGTLESGALAQTALAAGAIAELLLAKRIARDEKDQKKRVEVVDRSPLGEVFLDACLERIAQAERRATLDHWVMTFAGTRDAIRTVAESLCVEGILREDQRKVLGLFSQRTFPEADSGPERALRERITRAVLGDATDLDARTAMVVTLAARTNVLPLVLGKKVVKERRARIEQIAAGDAVGEAVKEVIATTQAVMMMTAILPAVTVATTS